MVELLQVCQAAQPFISHLGLTQIEALKTMHVLCDQLQTAVTKLIKRKHALSIMVPFY